MAVPTEFPLIEISGPPLERGRQFGEQAADRIRRGIDQYAAQLGANGLGWSDIRAITAQFEPTIAGFGSHYITEMRGIAEGAGVEYAGVVLLNARTELLKLAERRAKGEPAPDDDPDGCTGLVALAEATSAGRLIHAQNWDWKAECAETSVVLRIRRDDGPDILTFTEAGMLGRFGFNAAGIAITGNYLQCDRDYRQIGVPLALIRRKVLEQQHLSFALHAVYATAKSASNNIIVSHAGGVAIDFECVPDETFQVFAAQGLIVHANHFQSPVALAKLLDMGVRETPDSLYRDIRVRDLLTPYIGKITRETAKAALFDDFETPYAVCRPPRASFANPSSQTATVAMIVMEPELGIMEVVPLPAINRQFKSYSLEMNIQRPTVMETRLSHAAA